MAAPAIPSFGRPNIPKINNGSSAILTSAPAIFQQNSADFFRSEIIAVCGFHKIIPCENSYFHRGFYARKSYKSMCFYVDFIPPNIILLAPGRIALLEFAIQLSTHYLFVSNFVISQITTNCINIMIPDTPIPHIMPIFP